MEYLLILGVLVALELVYFKIADKFNIIDKPNERSSHSSITRRGGGVIFLFGIWTYEILSGFSYPWFALGTTLIGIVSFIDDVKSLPEKLRLVFQFIAMMLMIYQLGILGTLPWWVILVTLIVSVGILNAYNFMDGINGITGGYSLAVLLPLIYLNDKLRFIDMQLLYVVLLSVLVFCFFNFRTRAKCFAGDVGSITIALTLIFILGKLMFTTRDFSYIIFLGVYGVDAVLTIVHRIMLHENLGKAHRKHAYQLMANELHKPHVGVSAFYMLLQLAISAGLIFLDINQYLYAALVVLLLCVAYVAFIRRNYHLHEAYLKSQA